MEASKVNYEYERLMNLYKEIPENKKDLVSGLILEAARLKVSLDELWEDILEHGTTELDEKGKEKERPTSAIFTTRDKSYRATINKLEMMLPAGVSKTSTFSKLEDDEDGDED